MTQDDTELWVSAELSSEIYVIDRAANEVKDVLEYLPPGFRIEDVTPVGIDMTKDGSKALVSLGRANHIAIVDVASKEVIQYVLVGNRAWSVALNHDDSVAIVANGLSDDITVVDMTTMKAVKSIPVGRVPHSVLIDD
jgi:YVTN family beta-propeller protein